MPIFSKVIIVVCAIGFGVYTYSLSDWQATTPDSAQLACAAQQLVTTGTFAVDRTRGFDFNYTPCWTVRTYPVIQLVTAGVTWLTGDAVLATTLLAIALFTICVWLIIIITSALTENAWVQLMGGWLALTSLSLDRALLLTPHNLYGYALILLSLALLAQWRRLRWYHTLWLGAIVVLLFLTHQMSFAVWATTLSLYLAWTMLRQRQWWLLSAVLLVAFGMLVFITHTTNPLYIFTYLRQLTVPGTIKPLWDHFAIWGYIHLMVASLGIGCLFHPKRSRIIAVITILAVVSIFATQLYWFGINLLPERLSMYNWIPIVLFAVVGIDRLWQLLPRWAVVLSMVSILVGTIVHASAFIASDFDEITRRYLPSDPFIQAMQWLEQEHTADMFVVGVAPITNREISYAGLYYQGDITAYPWFILNHKDIDDFSSTHARYQPVFDHPSSTAYQQLYAVYQLLTKPHTETNVTAVDRYGFSHVLLHHNGPLLERWERAPFPGSLLVYKNEEYVIYAL